MVFYGRYSQNPASVDPECRVFFKREYLLTFGQSYMVFPRKPKPRSRKYSNTPILVFNIL